MGKRKKDSLDDHTLGVSKRKKELDIEEIPSPSKGKPKTPSQSPRRQSASKGESDFEDEDYNSTSPKSKKNSKKSNSKKEAKKKGIGLFFTKVGNGNGKVIDQQSDTKDTGSPSMLLTKFIIIKIQNMYFNNSLY